jgi:hypothetical protein
MGDVKCHGVFVMMPTCVASVKTANLELFNSHKARRPVMDKTLELISLDDSELLEVTGGCGGGGYCHPCCEPCCPSVELDVCLKVCV